MRKGLQVSRFVLNELIGKGGFGEVWAATSLDDHFPVAVKVEDLSNTKILEEESKVMKKLNDSPCFPHFIAYWEEDGRAFLVMELLQSTVKQTTEAAFGGVLSLRQVASIGIPMLKAVQSLHEHGYIHRDIKPSNFMYRPGNSPPDICLIDFGMAKLWRNAEGLPIPARYGVGFRGTSRYASLNSHDGSDLSCRDDLWSLFYVLVEMAAPPLPWHNQSSRDVVAQIKRKYGNRLVLGLPSQFQELMEYITGLEFCDVPDYAFILQKLIEIKQIGEEDDLKHSTSLDIISSLTIDRSSHFDDTSSVACSDCDAPFFERSFSKEKTKTENIVEVEPKKFRCCLLI